MTTLIKEQIQTGSPDTSSAVINIDDWAGRVSLDIIGKAGFGSDFHSLAQPENPLNTAYRAAFLPNEDSRKHFIWSLITHPTFINLLPIENSRRLRQGVRAVTKWIRDFVAKRQNDMSENVGKEGSKGVHQDIISAASKHNFSCFPSLLSIKAVFASECIISPEDSAPNFSRGSNY